MTKIPNIRVKNAGVVILDRFVKKDGGGSLHVHNARKATALELPIVSGTSDRRTFPIKRFFFIRDVNSAQAQRANHAHYRTNEVVFCVNGSCTIHLDDGITKQRIRMHDPAVGILHGPGLWHKISNFSNDCILLAFADTAVYDPSEYMYDYQEFLKSLSAKKKKA